MCNLWIGGLTIITGQSDRDCDGVAGAVRLRKKTKVLSGWKIGVEGYLGEVAFSEPRRKEV